MTLLTKTCSLCKQTKPITDFGSSGTRRTARCKPCYRSYSIKAQQKRNSEVVKVECDRCGYRQTLYLSTFEKRVQRGRGNKCDSCAARRSTMIRYGKEFCFPWGGEFDDNDNPMKNGELYKPGVRLCGHRDCTNLHHIQLAKL